MGKKKRVTWKQHFHNMSISDHAAHDIAIGFALGTFLAILPTFGLGLVVGVLVMLVYDKMSKAAMLVSFAVWNPLVLYPMFFLSFQLGNLIIGTGPMIEFNLSMMDHIYNYSLRFMIGNLIISSTVSIGSFFLIKNAVNKYRKKIKE
ncbi:DUF2062 domain-containing protein [Nanoarchaeota archaeon]